MRKKITTTISLDDAGFLRSQDTKVAHAIRVYCEERRTGKAEELEQQLKTAKEDAKRRGLKLANVMQVIAKHLPAADFDAILAKV